MAKNTANDITGLGFTAEMFGETAKPDFLSFIDGILSEQSVILEGRTGSSRYAATTSPVKDYVKRAEKCLVAAELVQRRINIILGNTVGAGREIDISHEAAQKKAYLDEAEMWITKLVGGISADTGDFASGVLITSHFNDSEHR